MADTPTKACPECGADLSQESPYKHSFIHWPERITPRDPTTAQARERQAALWAAETDARYRGRKPE